MAALVSEVARVENLYLRPTLTGLLQNAGLTVRDLDNGRGDCVVASKEIKKGTELLKCPLNEAVLMASTPQFLAQLLLEQKFIVGGVKNEFFENLNRSTSVPGSFALASMTTSNKNDFDGTLLKVIAERRAREAEALSSKMALDLNTCQNALHTVHSRCLFIKELSSFVLPPFVEYLNHDPNASAAWHVVEGEIVVRSCNDIKKGDEVTISYGEHSNEVFAIQYFFIPPANPFDILYLPMRRELTVMRVAKFEGTSVEETNTRFVPYGFVEYGEKAMEIARVIHPDDPEHFIHFKLQTLRKGLEDNMINLMKRKRRDNGLDPVNTLWLDYFSAKVSLINRCIKKHQTTASALKGLVQKS